MIGEGLKSLFKLLIIVILNLLILELNIAKSSIGLSIQIKMSFIYLFILARLNLKKRRDTVFLLPDEQDLLII